MSDRASAPAFALGTNGLRGILNDHETVFLGDRYNGIHIRHLAVEMNGNDCARLAGDLRLDLRCIEVVSHRINVHENRRCTQAADSSDRRKKSIRGSDHLVAGPDVFSHQASQQSVAA